MHWAIFRLVKISMTKKLFMSVFIFWDILLDLDIISVNFYFQINWFAVLSVIFNGLFQMLVTIIFENFNVLIDNILTLLVIISLKNDFWMTILKNFKFITFIYSLSGLLLFNTVIKLWSLIVSSISSLVLLLLEQSQILIFPARGHHLINFLE